MFRVDYIHHFGTTFRSLSVSIRSHSLEELEVSHFSCFCKIGSCSVTPYVEVEDSVVGWNAAGWDFS